jgi:hypothetical protein
MRVTKPVTFGSEMSGATWLSPSSGGKPTYQTLCDNGGVKLGLGAEAKKPMFRSFTNRQKSWWLLALWIGCLSEQKDADFCTPLFKSAGCKKAEFPQKNSKLRRTSTITHGRRWNFRIALTFPI